MNNPVFKHDCKQCVFLDHFDGRDLYVCPVMPEVKEASTLLARFGNDDGDYISDWNFHQTDMWIKKARELAIEKEFYYPYED